jgi:adenosine deaminase
MDLNKREAVPVPGGTDLKTLPKALLHEHLDGGLRPQTLLDLCRERGVQVPAADADSLARWMQANANSGTLERYLKGFAITIAAMATEAACERVAYEAAEDAAADGCVLAEFRLAPLLWEPHGLPGEAVMEAILAGAERYYPPSDHAESMEIARDGGLGLTCHAGESDGGERVLEAAGLGASRIGHGINVVRGDSAKDTRERVAVARGMGLHFEVCPSSNVHTGAVTSLEVHPIRDMLDAGLSVSCSTDNRLMSGVTLTSELESLRSRRGFTNAELARLMRAAVAASFLPDAERNAAMVEMERGWAEVA